MELSKASKLTILSYASQLISMVLMFFEAKILTSRLSVDDYGAYNQVLTTVSLITIVLSLNLGHGFIRLASSYSAEKKEKVFHTVLLSQTFLYFVAAVLVLPFGKELSFFLTKQTSVFPCIFIGLLAISSGFISNIQNYLLVQGNDVKMVKQNIYKIISDVLFVVFAVIIYPSVFSALLGCFSSTFFCVILFSISNRISYHKIAYRFDILRELLVFSLPLLIASITYWLVNCSNRYFINYYWGLDYVGQFAIANKLPMMIVTIFTLLSTVFLSNTSRLYDEGNLDRVSFWFSNMIKVFIWLGVFGSSFLILAHRPITLFLSNDNYLFPNIASFYLWLCIGSVSFGLFQIISKLYDLEKQVKKIGIIWTIILILNTALNFILIPPFALLGAAWSFASTFIVGLLLAFLMRPKTIRLECGWIMVLSYSFAGFFLPFLSIVFLSRLGLNPWVEALIALIISVLVLFLGFILKIVNLPDLRKIIFKS